MEEDKVEQRQMARHEIYHKEQMKNVVDKEAMQQSLPKDRVLANTDEKHSQQMEKWKEETWTPAVGYVQWKAKQTEHEDEEIRGSRRILQVLHG